MSSSIKLYKVGGYVRDSLLGIKSKDIDFAVECSSFQEMKDYIVQNGGTIYLEKPEFLTLRGKLPQYGDADFACCRVDGIYHDFRRPSSTQIGNIKSDLSRRDFTINAIAVDENNNYYDPFNGIKDINDKIIRCVGNTSDRFNEDGLRILRALRFAVTKNFKLHDSIIEWILNHRVQAFLVNVSTERIREELTKMFRVDTERSMSLLHYFGLYKILFKQGLWLKPTMEK